MTARATRGTGLLESWLAKQRSQQAVTLLESLADRTSILDLGCGYGAGFLSQVNFLEKFGLDKDFLPELNSQKMQLTKANVLSLTTLPFPDNFFNAVTATAFFEHLPEAKALELQTEVYRILKPNGRLVITVPRDLADKTLKFMAKINLVSAIEINEHVQLYTKPKLQQQLLQVGFLKKNIKIGYFEGGLNIYAQATK